MPGGQKKGGREKSFSFMMIIIYLYINSIFRIVAVKVDKCQFNPRAGKIFPSQELQPLHLPAKRYI